MPLLGGLLSALFSGFAAWLAQFVTRKVAFAGAAIAFLTGITLALYVVMRTTLGSLANVATGAHQMIADGITLGVPPVATVCLSLYMTMWTACTVYVWQRDLLHVAVKA